MEEQLEIQQDNEGEKQRRTSQQETCKIIYKSGEY